MAARRWRRGSGRRGPIVAERAMYHARPGRLRGWNREHGRRRRRPPAGCSPRARPGRCSTPSCCWPIPSHVPRARRVDVPSARWAVRDARRDDSGRVARDRVGRSGRSAARRHGVLDDGDTSDVPIVAERAMWWRTPSSAGWVEGHTEIGATAGATQWAVADMPESAFLLDRQRILRRPARYVVTYYSEAGGGAGTRTYALPADGRVTAWPVAGQPVPAGRALPRRWSRACR